MSSLLRQAPSIDHVGTAALGCPAERSSACFSGNRIQTTAGHRLQRRRGNLPTATKPLPKLKMLTHGNLAAPLQGATENPPRGTSFGFCPPNMDIRASPRGAVFQTGRTSPAEDS